MLRRLFRGFPLDEMNARLALEFPERAAIQASIKEYVGSLSLSVCLSPSLAPFVSCEIPQALAKVQISASCFCFFFSLFFCQRKTQTGKMFRKLTHFVYRLIPVAQ